MNNNYYADDNSAMDVWSVLVCPFCGWVPTMLVPEHSGSFLNVRGRARSSCETRILQLY